MQKPNGSARTRSPSRRSDQVTVRAPRTGESPGISLRLRTDTSSRGSGVEEPVSRALVIWPPYARRRCCTTARRTTACSAYLRASLNFVSCTPAPFTVPRSSRSDGSAALSLSGSISVNGSRSQGSTFKRPRTGPVPSSFFLPQPISCTSFIVGSMPQFQPDSFCDTSPVLHITTAVLRKQLPDEIPINSLRECRVCQESLHGWTDLFAEPCV